MFFKKTQDQDKFKQYATESFNRALSILNVTINTCMTPYYDLRSHIKSAAHPLIPIAQLINHAVNLTRNAFILTGSLLSLDNKCFAHTACDMVIIVFASTLEIVNIFLSIASFFTRTLASILNLGYPSFSTNLYMKPLQDHEDHKQDQNIESMIKNMWTNLASNEKNKRFQSAKAQSTDEIVHHLTFTIV